MSNNDKISSWWNKNPFTYGVVGNDQVGGVDLSLADLIHYEQLERRFRKHSLGAAQEDGAPLLSNYINYQWLTGKDVLDIAVGSGVTTSALARVARSLKGIDITEYAVRSCRNNLRLRGLEGVILIMDAQAMTFNDIAFDFVNAWGCLMHMPQTERACAEIYRVLRPGGRVLAYMYNKNSFSFWFNIFFVRGILMGYLLFYRGNVTRLVSRFTDGSESGGNPLTKVYTKKQVDRMFQDAGFKNVFVRTYCRPHVANSWPLRIFPVFKYLPQAIKTWLSRTMDWGLIVTAEK